MLNECSWSNGAAGCVGVDLERIWHVDADERYGNVKNWREERGLVAVRTLDGAGTMTLDGLGSFDLPADTVLLMERQRIRRYATAGQCWRFWWFEFTLNGPMHFPLHHIIKVSADRAERENLRCCFDWLRGEGFASRVTASAVLAMLLYRWAMQWHGHQGRGDPNRQLVGRVIETMRADLSKSLSVTQLAEAERISPRWFRRVFRQITGSGPKQYYDALRLDTAAELLRMGLANVSQVADQLGYSSAFHFSKAFKKHHGSAPRKYKPPLHPLISG